MALVEGELMAGDARVALVAARWNGFVVESLISGARDVLRRHGMAEEAITLVRVPGAFELPLALDRLAASGRYHGLVALGTVIRGSTPHFGYVAGECVRGISQASLKHGIPIALGVLTTESIEQAIERAGTKAGNKGGEAATTVLEMINLLTHING